MPSVWNVVNKVLDTSRTQCTAGFKGYEGHKGADLIPNSTSEIPDALAMADGKVIYVLNTVKGYATQGNPAMGNTVVIECEDGAWIRYQHLSPQIYVSKGQYVVKGQRLGSLGKAGTTYGNSTGRHLHFDISYPTAKNSNYIKSTFMDKIRYYIDPKPFLTGEMTTKKFTTMTVKNDVNIRSTPSTSGKLLGEYKKGTKVTILEKSGVWVKTEKGWCNNNNGYFFK